jgi:hypothetical protein
MTLQSRKITGQTQRFETKFSQISPAVSFHTVWFVWQQRHMRTISFVATLMYQTRKSALSSKRRPHAHFDDGERRLEHLEFSAAVGRSPIG